MKSKLWLLAILFLSFAVVSCDEDEPDPEPVNEAEVLIEYLESTDAPYGGFYVNNGMPSIKTASHVKEQNTLGKVYIVDIRSATDFADGHILNAVNVGASDVYTHLESADLTGKDEIAIVCYTGQTAGWVTSLLCLAGYDNVYSMKFGMCSWHADFAGKWSSNIGNAGASYFTSDATAKGAEGDLPLIATGKETGQEILDARIAAVFLEGFGEAKVSNTTVLENTDDYYVVNYWPAAEYTDPGHITGAVQYEPKQSMSITQDLKTLSTEKPVVVYCYTGQNSANLAAYLRVIGYDAKSLLFGANGMIYDDMTKSKWSEAAIMGYDYEGM